MSQAMDEQTPQRIYGGCEGPDAMYVKLISSDGHEFIGKSETIAMHLCTLPVLIIIRLTVLAFFFFLVLFSSSSSFIWCVSAAAVKREHALTSGTIKAMLSGPGQFAENEANEVNFREIPSHVLQKVCMYFTYKVRYTNSSTEIPEFPIAPEIALELLMAANFLDCWTQHPPTNHHHHPQWIHWISWTRTTARSFHTIP